MTCNDFRLCAGIRVVGLLGFLNKGELSRLVCICRRFVHDDETWATVTQKLWACPKRGQFKTWYQCLYYLENSAKRIALEQNLNAALQSMACRGIVGDIGQMCYALLHRHSNPQLRRCVAAYATEDVRFQWKNERKAQVKSLCHSLANELRQATDVEDALRRVLEIFPFLPALSSHGADRVIDQLSKVYATVRAERTYVKDFESFSPLESLFIDQNIDIAATSYIIWYAIIMLNTDLHNPRVQSKITEEGFVRSLAAAAAIDAEQIARTLYRSIKQRPLVADRHTLQWSTRIKHRPSSSSRARRLFYALNRRHCLNQMNLNLFGLYVLTIGLLLLLFRLSLLLFFSPATISEGKLQQWWVSYFILPPP
mmetsp:Transcript_7683/g.10690  ORF Transcript_7683/g.10690 Transcript_7683/m.10690 type:complete len:368 (+) Transcript_7683:130-1233(+)